MVIVSTGGAPALLRTPDTLKSIAVCPGMTCSAAVQWFKTVAHRSQAELGCVGQLQPGELLPNLLCREASTLCKQTH